jgi:large subunit ribosomal protein L21
MKSRPNPASSPLTAFSNASYTLGLSSEASFWRELTVAYAIIEAGGKQFRVTEGEVVRVPVIDAEVGASVELDSLLQADGDDIKIGLAGTQVKGTIVEHGRDKKVIVFKKKRRKQYKKTHGHRQDFTAVLIDSIASDKDE